MLRFFIKRMVVRNQEAKDVLETYLKTFHIAAFPGENVPIACLRLKAIAWALGNNDLPKKLFEQSSKVSANPPRTISTTSARAK